MILSFARGVRGKRSSVAGILGLTVVGLSFTASARAADIEVTGLPKGLTVGVRFNLPRTCGGLASVNLTQEITPGVGEQIIGGQSQIRPTEKVRYTGTRGVDLGNPANANCNSEVRFSSDIVVLGRRSGSTAVSTREARVTTATLASARILLKVELKASTPVLVDVETQAPPSGTITRGVQEATRWAVAYEDPFGGDSAFRPALSFFVPPPPDSIVGTPGTLAFKIEVRSNNQACLFVGGAAPCGNLNQNISLSAGGVTVTRVVHSVSNTQRNVTWHFRLAAPFAAGQFDAVMAALDKAPLPDNQTFQYQIGSTNEFQEKQILSWGAKKIRVTVQ